MAGGEDFSWMDMVTSNNDADIPSSDDFAIPMTQDTYAVNAMATEVEEVDILEATQKAPRTRSTRPNQKREKNFDHDEDKDLCAAWLYVSKDPISGAIQKQGTFWGKVHAYYNEHKKSSIPRSESSLMHRWLTIQAQVNKFCSAYEKMERRNQSGVTIQGMITDAHETYKELDVKKRSFTLMHCWYKLKDDDKWKAERQELLESERRGGNKNKKLKTTKDSSPTNDEANNNGAAIEIDAPSSEERKRPIGNKKAKEALKRGGGEATIQALDKIWGKKEAFDMEKEKKKEERFNITVELEKERLANEKTLAESKLMKEEKDIMLADKTRLDPWQLKWIEAMQKKIIARLPEN